MCLPILSAWYRKTGEKPALALANFDYADESIELLKKQDCIREIIRFDHTPRDHIGGWPYKGPELHFQPSEPFFNLGFRGVPDKPLLDFVAEEHQLEIDENFVLIFGEPLSTYAGQTVIIDKYEKQFLFQKIGSEGVYLSKNNSISHNLALAAGAQKVITWTTGAAMLLLSAGIPCTIYGENRLREYHLTKVYNRFQHFDFIGVDL